MKIKARFIGSTSCGFITGFVYYIRIYTDSNDKYVWVKNLRGLGLCPYRSIKTLAENWEIPVKDEFVVDHVLAYPMSDNYLMA